MIVSIHLNGDDFIPNIISIILSIISLIIIFDQQIKLKHQQHQQQQQLKCKYCNSRSPKISNNNGNSRYQESDNEVGSIIPSPIMIGNSFSDDEDYDEEYDNNQKSQSSSSSTLSSSQQLLNQSTSSTSSFLSPLNYTTGPKNTNFNRIESIKNDDHQLQQQKQNELNKSKKNQSYYVSTYYSSCEIPEIPDTLISNNIGEPSADTSAPPTTPTSTPLTPSSTSTPTIKDTNSPKFTLSSSIEDFNIKSIIHKSGSIYTSQFNLPPTDLPLVNSSNSTIPKKKKKKSCILPQILHLRWKNAVKKVLVIHKKNDHSVIGAAKDVSLFLDQQSIITVCESEHICDHPTVRSLEEINDPYSIDFIVSLGGDGTILHTSSLFKTYIPPIISFNMGSLGFLTTFDPNNWKEHIKNVIDGKCFVSYRLRLSCTVISGNSRNTYQVLNEVTIDRGNNPYLSNLECSCDDKLITIVQADGLIIATSTGSTAYSLSAGGSLVHPTIPAILITPICPHTLSFRPVILPSTSTLVIRVPETSRTSTWASFDGKNRHEIKQGDSVVIKTSKWAVPVICKTDESNEWFEKLANNLNWNTRVIQKSFS